MKPKATNSSEVGMLEYLEDIIGSNKYVERIESTAKELETLTEERTEKLNRVKLVEKERDGLEVSFTHTH
jgi:structural maintenance of chromosome 4